MLGVRGGGAGTKILDEGTVVIEAAAVVLPVGISKGAREDEEDDDNRFLAFNAVILSSISVVATWRRFRIRCGQHLRCSEFVCLFVCWFVHVMSCACDEAR